MKIISISILLFIIATLVHARDSLVFYPVEDAYIRGGEYSSLNFGTENKLTLKNDGDDSYDRIIFLKFNLKELNTSVESATLKLSSFNCGTSWNGNTVDIYHVPDNSWDESTITWNTAPESGDLKIPVISKNGMIKADIMDFVLSSLEQDSIMTIGISKPAGGSQDWCDFASREHEDTLLHPGLLINGDWGEIGPETVSSFIYPADNRIDWSAAGVEGEIPEYAKIMDISTQGGMGNGIYDNSATVQDVIDHSPPGTVIFFPEGTYLFNTELRMKDSIVLRGACVKHTTLWFDLKGRASPSIWFRSDDTGDLVTITSGYEKGSDIITVEDASGFVTGQYVEIIQDNDPDLMYTNEDWNTDWAQNSVGQVVRVTDINGNNISLERPLYYTFSPELNARAGRADLLTGAGLENCRIFRADDGDDYNLRFYYASNCWIRNIEGDYCDRGHVEILWSTNIEIRDSYFHHAYNYGGGGHGYGVNLADHPTDCLIENNIFHNLRHAFLAKEGAIGNVFAYNYSRQPEGSANDIAMHGHYGLMNLLEGNIVQKIIAGDYWGPSGPGNTYFRNRVESDNIIMQDETHAQNIIANELIKGTVLINSNTNDTWQHSNYNKNGLIDKLYSEEIPNSLYLDSKPDFFGNMTWPATGPEYVPGTYTIPAKLRWDEGDELVACLDIGYNPVSLDQIHEHTFLLFPNPVTHNLTITNNTEHVLGIELYNSTGQRILTKEISAQKVEIDMQPMDPGIYFVRISNRKQMAVRKIIKK